ncbi:MAG: Zn-dependent oligopeptidase [Acidobacteria bacterium]|nr:Zn-dependent oligopeptidase [Acidobacteriota bacterium]
MVGVLRLALILLPILFVVTLMAQETSTQPTIWAAKPDVTAFEKVENDRLAAAQKAVDELVAVKEARTIDNTLAPFDEAVHQLGSAQYFAGLMQQVHPEATFRDHATEMVRKASAAVTALSLNRQVYDALSALDVSQADPATRYYVQRQLLLFKLAGVDKDDAIRARLKKLQDDLTEQQSMFDRNVSDGQKTIIVNSASELDGLPQDYIDRHKPGPDGKVRITTEYPDVLPALKFVRNDDLRRRLFQAFHTRAYPKNLEVLKQMMQTRYEIAQLLGYASWADYNAADKMILNGGRISDFIQQVDAAAKPVAKREFALLLEQARKTKPNATQVGDYESQYLQEQVRRASYNFDSQSVRPYFPFNSVKKGILDTAAQFFHLEFRQEVGAPGWDPTVETWDVYEQGKMTGRFYLDLHPRPGKYSHAEMAPVLDGIRGKQLPEAILVCNFPAPTADDPGLMEYSDVVTFFHEFGHLMHWILSAQQWAGVSGMTMESDFVEAPSQMLEELMHSPQVLAGFAHHYKTGDPIPADLVERMNRASAFGRGTWATTQNSYTAISYDLYKGKPQTIDPDAVTQQDVRRYTLFVPTTGTHMYASFTHLGGYSSAYYTYLWDKVIAEDFYRQFNADNPLSGDVPMRYRKLVLEPGGSMSANDLVKNFLGRPENMTAFEQWMSEEFQVHASDAPATK